MKRKLLIFEDDQVLRETTAAFLEAEGFVVKTAADGKTGFELASKEKADLIVTDLMLPELNGLEICRKLRSLARIIHKLRHFLEKRIRRWRRIQDEGDTIPNSGEFGSCPRIRRPSANSRPGEIASFMNNSD